MSEPTYCELKNTIEIKRKSLIETAQRYGFTSEKTLQASQELDMIINEFHELFQYRNKFYYRGNK